jgi:hypothetical protein
LLPIRSKSIYFAHIISLVLVYNRQSSDLHNTFITVLASKVSFTLTKNQTTTTGCWWLTPVILASWEAEIGRMAVQGQPRQIVHKTPSPN